MGVILHGKPVQERVLAEVKAGVDKLKAARGVTPALAVVLIGGDPASHVYVGHKRRAADAVGIIARDELHPEGLGQRELNALLRSLSDDPGVHGILLQLPLPKGLDEAAALACIAPEKDVDGLHPTNLGKLLAGEPGITPCTPSGCLEILDHYGAKLEGAEAVVIGRSRLVGKPLAQLLLARQATVTMCHTRTRDLAFHTRRADILCVAAGRPRMITGDMVKEGAWVVDVGVNRLDTGKLAGDVDLESVQPRAAGVTPVPGGVGLMTIAMLLRNTLAAAERLGGGLRPPSDASPPASRGQSPRSN